MFTVYAKCEGERYLVFVVDICNFERLILNADISIIIKTIFPNDIFMWDINLIT